MIRDWKMVSAPPDHQIYSEGPSILVMTRKVRVCYCGVAIPPWVDICEKHFYVAYPKTPRQKEPPMAWFCDQVKVFEVLRSDPDLKEKTDEELLALLEEEPMLPARVGNEQALRRCMAGLRP
jgi:hypothetical protein